MDEFFAEYQTLEMPSDLNLHYFDENEASDDEIHWPLDIPKVDYVEFSDEVDSIKKILKATADLDLPFDNNSSPRRVNVYHVLKKLQIDSLDPLMTNLTTSAGINLPLQIDSGASKSLLVESDLKRLPKDSYVVQKSDYVFFDIQNNKIEEVHPPIELSFLIDDEEIKNTFYIIGGKATHNILGLDFFEANDTEIKFKDGAPTVTITTKRDSASKENAPSSQRGAYLNSAVLEPGMNTVSGTCDQADGIYHFQAETFGPLRFPQPVQVKDYHFRANIFNKSINQVQVEHETKIAEVNSLEYPPKFPKNETEANEEMEELEPPSLPLYQEMEDTDWESSLKKNTHVPSGMLDELIAFLNNECEDLMSKHAYDIGTLDDRFGIMHDVDIGDVQPSCAKPYVLDPKREEALRKHLLALESIGHIKRGLSPYGMPVFMIVKPNSNPPKYRLLTDARWLNSHTRADNYPIKKINQIYDSIAMSKARVYSVIDLSSGFSSIKLTERASKLCSFVTSFGQFLPLRMSQGLTCSPFTFSLAMGAIIREIAEKTREHFCECYLDDLCVFSSDVQSHLRHLKIIFKALKDAGLKINLQKLSIFQTSVELLGRELSFLGTRILPKHVKAVEEFERPRNAKETSRFLGLMNFLSNCIWAFAKLAIPLTRLLRKNTPFVWGNVEEEAFQAMKAAVTRAVCMYNVDLDEPVYCLCDASLSYYAGILYQIRSFDMTNIDEFRQELLFHEQFSSSQGTIPTVHPILPSEGKNSPGKIYLSPIAKVIDQEQRRAARREEIKAKLNDDQGTLNEQGIPNLKTRNLLTEKLEDAPELISFLSETDKLHVVLPISFCSGTFSETQARWTILEREAYGMMRTLVDHHQICSGAKACYVVNDNMALIWLSRLTKLAKGNVSKVVRWMIKLRSLPFQCIVSHCIGQLNAADALSRPRPVVWKANEYEGKLKAFTVASPFPIGTVITLDMIDNYIMSKIQEGFDPIPIRDEQPSKYVNIVRANAITSIHTQPLADLLSPENIRKEQLLDPKTRKLMENPSDKEVVDKGLLYRIIEKDGSTGLQLRIYLPQALVGAAISYMHWNNHVGGNSLAKQLASIYYFKKLVEQTLAFSSSCGLCAISKPARHGKTKLKTQAFALSPKLHAWSVDVLNGYTQFRGSDYIMVLTEYHTKFKIVCRIPSLTGEKIAQMLEEKLFAIFGVPRVLTSDAASYLTANANVRKTLLFYGCEFYTGVSYSPQSHGFIERSVQSSSELLRILINQYDLPWWKLLNILTLSLNLKPLTSLGSFSSHYAMFGYEMNHLYQPSEKHILNPYNLKGFWEIHEKIMEKASKAYKKHYETKRNKVPGKTLEFKAGSFCYLKDFSHHIHPKEHARYLKAPWLVIRELSDTVVCKSFQGKTVLRHKNSIRPAKERFANLYLNLPLLIKHKLGDSFESEILKLYVQEGYTPQYFDDTVKTTSSRPLTRSLNTEDENDTIDYPLDGMVTFQDLLVDSDEDEGNEFSGPVDENGGSQRVTFADGI